MNAQAQNWYDSDVATFGDRLTAAREASGMGQAELAKRVGVKVSTLRKWEDDVSEPRANRLSMVAGLLGVSITWLMTGEGDGIDPPGDEPAEVDREATAMLVELRDLRVALTDKAAQVGRIEKRLRRLFKERELG